MGKLMDHVNTFERRPVYAIYGVKNDYGFGCMDKVAIALDLGFEAAPSGIVHNVVPHPLPYCGGSGSIPLEYHHGITPRPGGTE